MTSSSATTGYLSGGQDIIAEFEGSGVSSEAATLRIQIPELLIVIFKKCSKATLATLARVCRAWSEIALDILWDDGLQSAIPLLEILTPGIKLGGPWSDSFNDANWDRFQQYANRVRRLEHSDPNEVTSQPQRIDEHYLTWLRSAKPPGYGPLLPRLRDVGWSVGNDMGGFRALKAFLSPSLKQLYIASSCETQTPEEVEMIVSLIADQPDIHLTHWSHLNLLSTRPNVEKVLIRVLRDQPDIVSLQLAYLLASGRLTAELATLQKLRQIHLMTFFRTASELEKFCLGISACTSSPSHISLRVSTGGVIRVIPFYPFRPLLKLRSLTHFMLNYAGKIIFEEADVVAMGEAWPLAQDLDLSWRTFYTSKIPVSLLSTFARSFGPDLMSLHVQVSFDDVPTTIPSPPPARFKSLRNIHFGASKIFEDELEGVAIFLSSILPVGITIQATKKVEETKIWTDLRALVQSLHAEGPAGTQGQVS